MEQAQRHAGERKSDQYRYDRSAIVDPNGRNKRSVWDINTVAYAGAHFATFQASFSTLTKPIISMACWEKSVGLHHAAAVRGA
jgi:hypothetical protein